MAIAELNDDNFNDTVTGEGIVLVDCWAPWCKACKDFQPVFEAAAERHPAHTFAKLNTSTEERLVNELGVENVPSLALFRDGVLLHLEAGYVERDGLDDIIAQAESLDMDAVNAAIAAEAD